MEFLANFRFSLRDLFAMTTLIGLGLGGVVWCYHHHGFLSDYAPLSLFVAVPCLTAGCFAPFQKKVLGALVGLCSVPLLVLVLQSTWFFKS